MTKLNEDDLKNITGAGGIGEVEPDPEIGEYERPGGVGNTGVGQDGGSGGGTPIDEDPPIQEL